MRYPQQNEDPSAGGVAVQTAPASLSRTSTTSLSASGGYSLCQAPIASSLVLPGPPATLQSALRSGGSATTDGPLA